MFIFALQVIGAPLAYGSVDRSFQILLLALLGLGILLVPPSLPKVSSRTAWLPVTLLGIVILKEFAPFDWFGHVAWRDILSEGFSMGFPWTHSPEPARAFDGLLTGCVAAIWFVWIRALADGRDERTLMTWILFFAAAVLAIVCFAMPNNPTAIYGLRSVPGWTGFGPFPNRNHTACFLAMGVLLGCGCVVSAIRHRRYLLFGCGLLCIGMIFVALIQSKSRGGISACLVGLFIYVAMALAKTHSHRAVAAILSSALAGLALFMAFGAKVWMRFDSSPQGDLTTNLRWGIWNDGITMWRDATLFGHGINLFKSLFPLYQTLSLENQIVLHPESSWLQWLIELGLVPTAIFLCILIAFLVRNVNEAFVHQRGVLLRAGGFAAVAVLLTHCLWDVPGHRWATAGYGLAALALASPMSPTAPRTKPGPLLALLPFAICLFWLLPFVRGIPTWSPTTLNRLIERNIASPGRVKFSELQKELPFFPLDSDLHEALGMRILAAPSRAKEAWQHFRIADRLAPSIWTKPALQAVASRPVSPGMTLHFWTLAIERAGHRSPEIFRMAFRSTADLPTAESFWGRYAETNPSLLLTYTELLPNEDGRPYFQLWWKLRGLCVDLEPSETNSFYALLDRWGSRSMLDEWMKNNPGRQRTDYRAWASLLHKWGDDPNAWRILSENVEDPVFPESRPSTSVDVLEANWLKMPSDFLNAQALAGAWARAGETQRSNDVITSAADQPKAPEWFLHKAAFIYASKEDFTKAVSVWLRDK